MGKTAGGDTEGRCGRVRRKAGPELRGPEEAEGRRDVDRGLRREAEAGGR
ncbi:MAG: hypothetical protein LBT40_11740 [Deltaproteobacteria bacterium]|jgi:hypothetical protein|nr:hypothetical protein [Deltaproteobacteria bacterium]